MTPGAKAVRGNGARAKKKLGGDLAVIQRRIDEIREQSGPEGEAIPFPVAWAQENSFAAPNVCLRSALFAATDTRGRGREIYDKLRPLPAPRGLKVFWKGDRLDQRDEDVFLTLLRHAKEHGMGRRIDVSLRSLLKALGLKDSGWERNAVKERIDRLIEGVAEFHFDGVVYKGHLIEFYAKDADDRYSLRFSPEMAELFAHDRYTLLDSRERLVLKSPLAKWLDGFIKSHVPNPAQGIKVATIRDLSGSRTQVLAHFRPILRRALNELCEHGIIQGWRIGKDDLVYIERDPSLSQARHLERRRALALS